MTDPKDATAATCAAQRAVLEDPLLDWDDPRDAESASRGLVGQLDPPVVTHADGGPVWDLTAYGFLDDPDAPDTVNPSLWRQARLNMAHGLFTIADRLHQVRGHDLSVMSLVEGETGWIVIDPLISAETAAASLALANEHLGERPVVAVIYTHSHVDHFGGVEGVTSIEDIAAGRTRIVAPDGFLEAAMSENVMAGTAMARRAVYMYGSILPRGPRGQVDAGLGKTTSTGTVSILEPTDVVTESGVLVLDGVELEIQLTPGTEAPAEMNFYFPQLRALCMAENCSRTLHNLYTPRGAQVRDARAWADYLDESIDLFLHRSDLVFTSHHWPVWGEIDCRDYLTKQRDMYRYIHDQTLRLANRGLTMDEIAEEVRLPPSLAREWHARDYYGTVSHDVKAVYQRYLGYFDGNPANLQPHPPVEAARRYVDYMGGAEAVLARARVDFDAGDYRWVAEVVNRVVFADPDNIEARELQADALEQLGYQAESGPWRNFYLMGALELREGIVSHGTVRMGGGMIRSMPLALVLDATTVRLNGERAAGIALRIDLVASDAGETRTVWIENAVLHHRAGPLQGSPDVTITAERMSLLAVVAGLVELEDLVAAGAADVEGDVTAFVTLRSLLDRSEPDFAIVTP